MYSMWHGERGCFNICLFFGSFRRGILLNLIVSIIRQGHITVARQGALILVFLNAL